MATKVSAKYKYYGNKKKTLKKDKVTYLQVSEYFSVVPEITNSGLMDGKYFFFSMNVASIP